MAHPSFKSEQTKKNNEAVTHFYEAIPPVVARLLAPTRTDHNSEQTKSSAIPSQESVIEVIRQTRSLLFPGHFVRARLNPVDLECTLGQEAMSLFNRLSQQIVLSIQHDCLRSGQPCPKCIDQSHEIALQFIQSLPELKDILTTDVHAAYAGDPAAKSYDEVIFSYPGLFAITVYRMAHKLWELQVPLLPRMMTEYAHSLTGIDIHPGARIGSSFFIDHGTGVVIGETTEIGNRVRIYQGVTLGALSLPADSIDEYRDRKRHPTINDDVIIYSNATLLGENAIIGARSIIGGNVWITESVAPDTKVLLKKPALLYIGNDDQSGCEKTSHDENRDRKKGDENEIY